VHCGFGGEGRLVVATLAKDNAMLLGYVDRGGRDRVQVEDLERDLPDDPVQVMFAGPLPAMLELYPRLVAGLGARAKVERTLYPGHEMGFLDVLHPQVSKGEALEFLRARWNLAREETMAIGDNWNDRDMLTVAGRGLVMGNADPRSTPWDWRSCRPTTRMEWRWRSRSTCCPKKHKGVISHPPQKRTTGGLLLLLRLRSRLLGRLLHL